MPARLLRPPTQTSSPGTPDTPAEPPLPSLAARCAQFTVGLTLCAVGVWLSLQVGLGVAPWDVLHVGLARATGLSFGVVIVAVGVLVLGVSAFLGARPGLGTAVNVVVIGVALDLLLAAPWLDGLPDLPVGVRLLLLLTAVGLLGVGAGLYIGAGFGAGPRDSLMVAVARLGVPIGLARTAIELTVLVVGWLMAGPVGLGTPVIALATGPVVQVTFRFLRRSDRLAARPR